MSSINKYPELMNNPKVVVIQPANRKLSEAKTHEEKVATLEAIIAKRRATLEKFLTPAEQLKHGDHGVLVQVVRSMENPQVLKWFQQAEQDLGEKCMYSAMNFHSKDEEWGCEDTGLLATRCIDLILNGRKVRVAFYARDEDPVAFNVYTNYKIKFRDGSGEPYASILRTPNQFIYLLVIDPYYFDKTDDNWCPPQENPQCVLCPRKCEDPYGNNAQPLATGQCCQKCNVERVIPARMTDSVVKEILRENPNQKIKAGVMEDAYTYAEQLYKGEEKKTRLDYLRTKVCETLNIAVTSSPEEAQAALNLAKEKKKQEEQQGRLRGTGSGPAWEAFKEAEAFLKGAEELKEAAIKASEAEAKFLQELDRAPKEKKTEAKKQAKPAKKICSCGNKDCMPRPAKTAWVNGVKRDQTVLQNNWDRKHSAVV